MTAVLRIAVLGQTEVTASGAIVPLRSARQRQLLAVLALHHGTAISVDRIAEAVWGDDLPVDATAALHNHVARLRSVLGPAGDLIVSTPGRYGLAASVETDVRDFERQRASALEADVDEPLSGLLADALALWRGRAYEDLDTDTARSESVRLDELRRACEESRAAAVLREGRPQDAVALLEALCSESPLREHARLVLAEALVQSGRRADALRTLDDLRRRLVTELGLDPSPAVAALERVIIEFQSASDDRPEIRIHIPLPSSPVFGRDEDIDRVVALFDSARILTLVGPGGVGKTTLAVIVAERISSRFPDGVVVVDLTGANRDEDVAPAVARSLGIDRQGNVDWTERLCEALAGREPLLVIDNAEHVIDGVAGLINDVTRRTEAHVLVTSRQSLSVSGERVFAVEPFVVAAEASNPAIALFMDRAAATRQDWVDRADLAIVAQICARLDGLPLTIELAAAQLRYRTLQEIAAALDRPLDVLTGPTRSHDRHRGLRDLLDWSFQLLDPLQQNVFVRLATFTGGFDAKTGHDACRDLVGDPLTFERVLHGLIDRSLVFRRDRSYGSRYNMLATVRDFGLDRSVAEATGASRDACAKAIVNLFERGAESVFSAHERESVELFDDERVNLFAAHHHLVESAELELSARLAKSAYLMAFPRGRAEVGMLPEEVLAALARSGRHDNELGSILPELLGLAADAAVLRGEHATATQHIARGRALAAGTAADRYCVFVEADLALVGGDVARASALYELACDGLTMHGEEALAAWAAATGALARSYAGPPDDQIGAALRALESAETTGSASARGFCRYVLAEVVAQRDPAEGVRQLEAAITDAESVAADFVAGLARLSLATISANRGQQITAIQQYLALIALWQRLGNWTQQWNTLHNVAILLAENGMHPESTTLLAAITKHAPVETWGANAHGMSVAAQSGRDALGGRQHAARVRNGTAFTVDQALQHAQSSLTQLSATARGQQ